MCLPVAENYIRSAHGQLKPHLCEKWHIAFSGAPESDLNMKTNSVINY